MGLIASYILPHPPIIISEVGRGEEQKIQKTIDAFNEISRQIALIKPDVIVVSSPHAESYYDYLQISAGDSAKGDFKSFGSKVEINAKYDIDLIDEINRELQKLNLPAGTLGKKTGKLDHGTMIPLYFVNKNYQDYKLVRLAISGLSLEFHYEFGKTLDEVFKRSNKSIVYLASGDLSHKLKEDGPYGFEKEGPVFDKSIVDIVKSGDLNQLLSFKENYLNQVAECGLRSFIILAGVLADYQIVTKVLSYEGTFGVGYLTASLMIESNKEKQSRVNTSIQDPYVLLARESLKYYLLNKKMMDLPKDLPRELVAEKAGVFVSMKKFGQLRGCIGTTEPTTDSIAEEIIQNAVSSGIKDPRFPPVSLNEIKYIDFSVDVLKPAKLINSLEELDPNRFGVIVVYRGRSGLLLPKLEGVNTVEEQLDIALRKAGISKNVDYKIYRFEVIRHSA